MALKAFEKNLLKGWILIGDVETAHLLTHKKFLYQDGSYVLL